MAKIFLEFILKRLPKLQSNKNLDTNYKHGGYNYFFLVVSGIATKTKNYQVKRRKTKFYFEAL